MNIDTSSPEHLIPTSVIGSYPRPVWLREAIGSRRRGEITSAELDSVMDDAALITIKEHELAGVDSLTDGEMRRDEMIEFFAERLKGFVFYGDVRVWGTAHYNKPAVVNRISRPHPILRDEFLFTRRSTTKRIKVTITGPYTLSDWSYNEFYSSKQELAEDLAKVVNAEIRDLESNGAKFIQIDEPALSTHANELDWAIKVINRAVSNIGAKIGIHICYGDYSSLIPYLNEIHVSQFALEFANRKFHDLDLFAKSAPKYEIGLGVIDVHNPRVEKPEEVAAAISRGVELFGESKVHVNPDCGLKLLARDVAFSKLSTMVKGAQLARSRLSMK